ncbi:ribosome silencing factor [Olsenella sp. Marseille-QA0557]|uniref:Ribosomal silencing factor RsfS n=1 Tax=Candidatus Coprovicinus avistercoris TaxID=2840754 RepID=A0A9D1L553_9ACTN|nr:ribosome silencing factor [Candidatus Coprovicinus avistercoris]
MSVTPLELARVAAAAADEKKATDICLIDISNTSDICDYFLIASAANRRLADAIVDEIEERVRLNCNEKPFSIEGREELAWTLIDYGSVVVHIFQPEAREYYRLDKLWGDAPRVKLDLEGADAGTSHES